MPGDVRTECKVAIKEFAKKESNRKRPARLTFYDAKGGAGGSGIAAKAFEFIDVLLEQAVTRVGSCHCVEGCVECVCSELCKQQNIVTSKAGCEVILKCLLGREGEIDVEGLPWGEGEFSFLPLPVPIPIPILIISCSPFEVLAMMGFEC